MKKFISIILLMMISTSAIVAKEASGNRFVTRIDSLMESLYNEDAPGAALLIANGNHILYDRGIGLADVYTKEKIDGNTNFNIASISKQFTVAAILKLQEQGRLSVNDKVSKFFPEFKSDIWNKVRLSHLMSHSSGVPDLRPRTDKNFTLYATDKQSIEYMVDLDSLKFEPGTQYDYINPTFQILYGVIEKLSGKEFEDFQRENVFDPSSMKNVRYFSPETTIPNMAHGYIINGFDSELAENSDSEKKRDFSDKYYKDKEGLNWVECDYGEETFFATKSDGGIYTSTHELLNWELALDGNKCLSEESKELAYSKHTKVTGSPFCKYQNRLNTWYGYGWFIDNMPNRAVKIYHTGDNGGFMAYLAKYEGISIKVIMLENRNDHDRWNTQLKIENILIEEGLLK